MKDSPRINKITQLSPIKINIRKERKANEELKILSQKCGIHNREQEALCITCKQ